MEKVEICNLLKRALRHIIVSRNGQFVSTGSGVVVKEDGSILTAKHVLCPGAAGYECDKIIARSISDNLKYECTPCVSHDFVLDFDSHFHPIDPDLVILRPLVKLPKQEFVKLAPDIQPEGTEVIMGGVPDDVRQIFDFDQLFDLSKPRMTELKLQYEANFSPFFMQSLFKSAMIGKTQHVVFNNIDFSDKGIQGLDKISIKAAVYWLDNHLTYGGSGGPLVNLNGELVAIMTQKAFTAYPGNESLTAIPSGTGMAMSHHYLSWFLPYLH